MGNLVTEQMVPFATQRSDSWKMEEVPQQFHGQEKWERDELIRRELRLSDMERRLRDAKAFVEEFEERVQAERKQLKKGTSP